MSISRKGRETRAGKTKAIRAGKKALLGRGGKSIKEMEEGGRRGC